MGCTIDSTMVAQTRHQVKTFSHRDIAVDNCAPSVHSL